MAPLIVGSEGTLATITGVTLGLVPRPPLTRLMLLHYDDLRTALETVPMILQHDPSAVELVDRIFLELTRQSPEYGPRLNFISGDPRVVLIVEFAGDVSWSLAVQASALEKRLRDLRYQGAIVHQQTPEEIANVWAVRKAGLGLLMSTRGDAKPLAFVDDATVPVEQLADYALEVERACHEAGAEASFYAHASAGCLHINPMINLKTPAGLAQMRTISEAVARLAIAHGGTTTGEHGEGLARSYFNEQLFGPRLHQAFCELKGLFDPANIQNPGKIVNAPAPWDPGILRLGPEYRTPHAPTRTHLDFSIDGGYSGLVEMCNGQGVCRKHDVGVMCPSFMATRDEAASTRGYANALRSALTGGLGKQGLASPELHAALDLCLECKGCKRECPSLVDMAKLKYEFLAQYQAVNGVPLRSRLFGRINRFNRLASRVPRLANWTMRNRVVRALLDSTIGIDKRRTLPPIARESFQRWFNRRPIRPEGSRGSVILWDDTYLSYNEPEIGRAAVEVLEAAGFKVRLLVNRNCCGRPMISKGLLDQARHNAAQNVALLAPLVAQGMPVIGLEPSCIATFRDEYPDLLRSDDARAVAANSFFIEEFLLRLHDRGELQLPWAQVDPCQILVHGHCYQKALIGTGPLMRLLRLIPNATVEEIPSGCCGMAGSYGYEREHYDISLKVGEDRLFPAVRAADEATILVAPGTSCRHQIADGTGRTSIHPIVLLAEALA
jgi:Fe-S oxidoreductase